jgi:hypothetical protein
VTLAVRLMPHVAFLTGFRVRHAVVTDCRELQIRRWMCYSGGILTAGFVKLGRPVQTLKWEQAYARTNKHTQYQQAHGGWSSLGLYFSPLSEGR